MQYIFRDFSAPLRCVPQNNPALLPLTSPRFTFYIMAGFREFAYLPLLPLPPSSEAANIMRPREAIVEREFNILSHNSGIVRPTSFRLSA